VNGHPAATSESILGVQGLDQYRQVALRFLQTHDRQHGCIFLLSASLDVAGKNPPTRQSEHRNYTQPSGTEKALSGHQLSVVLVRSLFTPSRYALTMDAYTPPQSPALKDHRQEGARTPPSCTRVSTIMSPINKPTITMFADRWIVSQVDRRACLDELLLQNRCVLVGLDEPFAKLSIAFAEQLGICTSNSTMGATVC